MDDTSRPHLSNSPRTRRFHQSNLSGDWLTPDAQGETQVLTAPVDRPFEPPLLWPKDGACQACPAKPVVTIPDKRSFAIG